MPVHIVQLFRNCLSYPVNLISKSHLIAISCDSIMLIWIHVFTSSVLFATNKWLALRLPVMMDESLAVVY